VTIVIAENQREIAAELDRCGVAPCADTISQGKSDVIAFIRNYLFNFINSIDNREEQLMRGKQILDGRGAERVARIMLGET
jgi:spore coat polysaccharide biosynthesis predicted glycosyltransferase SpsG